MSRLSRFTHVRSLVRWLRGKLARRLMIIWKVLPAPVPVDIRVELQLSHAYTAKHSRKRDAKDDLPDDFERDTKGIPHGVL